MENKQTNNIEGNKNELSNNDYPVFRLSYQARKSLIEAANWPNVELIEELPDYSHQIKMMQIMAESKAKQYNQMSMIKIALILAFIALLLF